jgi:hypothetical protein
MPQLKRVNGDAGEQSLSGHGVQTRPSIDAGAGCSAAAAAAAAVVVVVVVRVSSSQIRIY